MRSSLWLLAPMGAVIAAGQPAAAVTVDIDLTRQRMHVLTDAGDRYDWAISSARSGFITPRGHYRPYSLQRMHYSRKYGMTPMPYSIFFRGGYAIHGTTSLSELGRPASHGCIRLAPENARALFTMVQHEGARIGISGTPPRTPAYDRARRGEPSTIARSPGPSFGYVPRELPVWDAWIGRPVYRW